MPRTPIGIDEAFEDKKAIPNRPLSGTVRYIGGSID